MSVSPLSNRSFHFTFPVFPSAHILLYLITKMGFTFSPLSSLAAAVHFTCAEFFSQIGNGTTHIHIHTQENCNGLSVETCISEHFCVSKNKVFVTVYVFCRPVVITKSTCMTSNMCILLQRNSLYPV